MKNTYYVRQAADGLAPYPIQADSAMLAARALVGRSLVALGPIHVWTETGWVRGYEPLEYDAEDLHASYD